MITEIKTSIAFSLIRRKAVLRQSRAMVARKVHILEADGSIPSSAILSKRKSIFLIFNSEDTLCYIQRANIQKKTKELR